MWWITCFPPSLVKSSDTDFKVSCPSPWKCTALFDHKVGEFLFFLRPVNHTFPVLCNSLCYIFLCCSIFIQPFSAFCWIFCYCRYCWSTWCCGIILLVPAFCEVQCFLVCSVTLWWACFMMSTIWVISNMQLFICFALVGKKWGKSTYLLVPRQNLERGRKALNYVGTYKC